MKFQCIVDPNHEEYDAALNELTDELMWMSPPVIDDWLKDLTQRYNEKIDSIKHFNENHPLTYLIYSRVYHDFYDGNDLSNDDWAKFMVVVVKTMQDNSSLEYWEAQRILCTNWMPDEEKCLELCKWLDCTSDHLHGKERIKDNRFLLHHKEGKAHFVTRQIKYYLLTSGSWSG